MPFPRIFQLSFSEFYLRPDYGSTCALNLRGRTACRLLDGIEHVEIASVTAWRYQGMSWRQDRETQEHEGTNQHCSV